MIEKWFEPFTLLESSRAADGLGGTVAAPAPVLQFQGALTFSPGNEVNAAGQPLLTQQPMLLHEYNITLSPGDLIRREKDGAFYRAADTSGSMRAPAFSSLRLCQVQVERVVLPC